LNLRIEIEMKCHKCGCDTVVGYRDNEKGILPLWACKDCVTKPVDPEVEEISELIAGEKKNEFCSHHA